MTHVLLISFIVLVALVLIWATTQPSTADSSRACPPGGVPSGVGCIDAKPVTFIEKCPRVLGAVKFYARHIARWRHLMGALKAEVPGTVGKCPRYLAHVLQRRSYALRKAYPLWRKRVWEHEYAWWKWLPAKYQRVGRCETGGTSGATSAGNFHWDSGTYVSAFGIIRAAFPTWNGHNSPREQYEVAASIQARYGWGAWGCGGA